MRCRGGVGSSRASETSGVLVIGQRPFVASTRAPGVPTREESGPRESPPAMTPIVSQVLFILLLIVANGLFSMAELAVASARKARLQEWADRGDRKAQAALDLASDPNRFLSTVQVGMTLISTFASVFGGATIAEKLATRLELLPLLAPYAGAISMTAVVASISYVSLVLGELVPK